MVHSTTKTEKTRDDETAAESLSRVTKLGAELSTWGRWGKEDQRGALNLIGPRQRVQAAAAIRTGLTYCLSLPLKTGVGPQSGVIGRANPSHFMTHTGDTPGPLPMGGDADFTDDAIMLSCQGSTQWDALSHIYYGQQLYNGVPATEVNVTGARRNGIEHVRSDLVGRGVLLDLARHAGRRCWDAEVAIRSEDLDACAAAQDVELHSGDILMIRTGAMTLVDGDDWSGYRGRPLPGLHHSVAPWLADHHVAAVAADNTKVEANSDLPGVMSPLHMIAIRDMGIHLGELWYLEDLAEACATDGTYDFFLAAQPLHIVGGVGSPVNPIAVK